jgi:hypothetical protein
VRRDTFKIGEPSFGLLRHRCVFRGGNLGDFLKVGPSIVNPVVALRDCGSTEERGEDHWLSGESRPRSCEVGGAGEEPVGFPQVFGLFLGTQLGALVRGREAGAKSGLHGIQQQIACGQHRELGDGIDFCVGLCDASEGGGTRRGRQFVPGGISSLILSSVPPVPREEGARDQEQYE